MSLVRKTMEFLLHSWSDKEVILDKCFRHLELIGLENYLSLTVKMHFIWEICKSQN